MTLFSSPLRAFALALLLTAPLAHADDAPSARVTVDWTDPANFSDTRFNPGLNRNHPEQWLGQLSRHLQQRADRVLPPGDRLAVTFTDVQRAGTYEPWRGPQWSDVRIIKDAFPPSIDLHFTLTDAQGRTVAEGDRKLRDLGFLQRGAPLDTDPLRFEKRLLDDWLRREFGTAAKP